MKQGIVYLVGAGPGDAGLISVKGLACIVEADVIVYDYLVNDSLLQNARPNAEIVYAGKMTDRHTMKQEEINELLAIRAGEGKVVCRLKGGDPFLFGRGGEEALHLKERGVLFEVVPGISAAMSVPAYAGIPVTHRGITSTFAAITGHEDPTKESSDIDWPALATGIGTLVFFMGVRNLPHIAKNLIENGRPADTPVAVIRYGTLPAQQTVAGTLADIADRVKIAGIKPPALIVVGEVVSLREKLSWFESRPLFGKRIVVTRARAQASDLVKRLESLGAEVIEFPTIRIAPPDNMDLLRMAVSAMHAYDWVIFTSVNGVESLMAHVYDLKKDARIFHRAKLCAIGPATADRLRSFGLVPDLVPEEYVAESVLEAITRTQPVAGTYFLLPRADLARPKLRKELEEKGAVVHEVVAYCTVPEDGSAGRVQELLGEGEIDLVTFTSSSTVKNFVELVDEKTLAGIHDRAAYASIGPITSGTLKSFEMPVAVEAKQYDIPGLVEAIVNYFREKEAKE